MLVHLSIGSNQGDRHAHIERAVALIVSRLRPLSYALSRPYESSAWGFESVETFVNVGLDLELRPIAPLELLDGLKAIERQLSAMPHRNADGSYRDREIDIDIILIDDLHIDTPRLKVPHPLMHLRPFVLEPLRELRGFLPDYMAESTANDGSPTTGR